MLLCPLGKVAGDMGEGAHPILVAIQKFSGEKNYCSESVSLEWKYQLSAEIPVGSQQFNDEVFYKIFNGRSLRMRNSNHS